MNAQLCLFGKEMPRFILKDCTQHLGVVGSSAMLERTLGGVWTPQEDAIKYHTTIQGQGAAIPIYALYQTLQVDCLQPFLEQVLEDTQGKMRLKRRHVPGSVRGIATQGDPHYLNDTHEEIVLVPDLAYVFYRPRLDMVIKDYSVHTDARGHLCRWTLKMEEV